MTTSIDVARYLLERHGPMEETKLHALLYYAQGWNLARTGKPMFSDDIIATADGAVPALMLALATEWHPPLAAGNYGYRPIHGCYVTDAF